LLTDDSGSLAIYGPMLERGWELGIEYATNGTGIAGGKTIKTVLKDTASNPDTGVTLAREAIEKDGAKILVSSPARACWRCRAWPRPQDDHRRAGRVA
jgi:branched-chain amino acid transport system substrate-binding protein